MLRKLKLFKRFPRFFWKDEERKNIVDPGIRGQYPELGGDFEVLDAQLMPYFWELDDDAKRSQNQFRREQVILILGTALATILGAIQAARPAEKWPGIAEAVLAAALAAVILSARTLGTHESYFTNRLKAERLRGEYFLFLGRSEPYSNDADRLSNLVLRVAEIRAEEIHYEPTQ
jgi:hypothetical protein